MTSIDSDYHARLSYLWMKSCFKRLCRLFAVNIIMTIKKVNDSSLMDAVSCLIRVSQYYHRMLSLHWWGLPKLRCSNVLVFQCSMFHVTMWWRLPKFKYLMFQCSSANFWTLSRSLWNCVSFLFQVCVCGFNLAKVKCSNRCKMFQTGES